MTAIQPTTGQSTIEVRNPADGTVVGEVPNDSAETVAAKARELRLFQPEWEAMGAKGRKRWLLKFQDWILDNAEHIADVLQSESGKPGVEAAMEAPMSADALSYWARNAEAFLADIHPKPHNLLTRTKRLTTAYRPYPVVGVITPWNFPFLMPAVDVMPALAAGASVLLKPSEVTPLTDKVSQLREGQDDGRCRFDVGAMATAAQRDIVQRHVDEALAAGARVTTGGKPTGVGTFFEPTVLADVDQSMPCMTAETFGPTLPVVKVADEDEAIRLANDSNYGLSGSVWTRDVKRGERVARRIETGSVNVNDVMSAAFSMALPFCGWKNSGIGSRSRGAPGVLKYCRAQAISAPRIPTQSREGLWYPYSRRKTRFAMGIVRATAARGLRRVGLKPRGGAR